MKESYSFQPSKEVVEILREIEKQTEETFNKIRIEMGPLAYSRLMGMRSKKEVDDFFESLTAGNFADFTPSLIDVYRSAVGESRSTCDQWHLPRKDFI